MSRRDAQGWRDVRSSTDISRLRLSCFELYSSVKLCGELRDFSGFIGSIVEQTRELLRVWGWILCGGLGWIAVGNQLDMVWSEREMHGRAEGKAERRQFGRVGGGL